MLSQCANSQCGKPFLRLGQGRLFQVEVEYASRDRTAPAGPHLRKQPRRVERYWLCDSCAAIWTLVHDWNNGILLVHVPVPPLGAQPEIAAPYLESA